MKKSVTQESGFGCGIACFAFVLGITYKQATKTLGPKQSKSTRFWCKDLVNELNKAGKQYTHRHIKPKLRNIIYTDGTIVLIRRSRHYPSGHYLVRYNNLWMDPWINLPKNKNIEHAISGYRKKLPGKPMYMLFEE